MITLEEVDGKLMKVQEIKIDDWNTKRRIVPISEKEFRSIRRNLKAMTQTQDALMDKHEEAILGHKESAGPTQVEKELSGEEFLNEVKAKAKKAEEFVPAGKTPPKERMPRKAFGAKAGAPVEELEGDDSED